MSHGLASLLSVTRYWLLLWQSCYAANG